MKPNIENHPAYVWGQLVRKERVNKRITVSDMAKHLKLDISKYSEIEHGILKWLTPEIETNLMVNLFYPTAQYVGEYKDALKAAKNAPPLTCLGDIFNVTDMLPAWPCLKKDGTRMSAREMIKLARFVLKPLKD